MPWLSKDVKLNEEAFRTASEEMEKLKESEFVPFIADILIKEADEKNTSISIDIDGQYYR